MNKRQFLKSTSALAATAMLSRFAHAELPADAPIPRTNWAGNLHYHAEHVFAPRSTVELQDLVRKLPHLRALGSRHSFNTIADTYTTQVSLEHFDSIDIDSAAKTVTVGAGVRYGTLAPVIDARGFMVHNLASLPHITVAGAIATATHGSGVRNGNLATAVHAIELVSPSGELITLSREDGPDFLGAIVHLGSLGVITRVTLDLHPRHEMKQVVYRNLSIDQLEHNLETIMSAGYSTSLFTNWQNHLIDQVWIKSIVTPGDTTPIAPDFFGAKAATENLHPVEGHTAEACTEQMGVPGPWYERLPHFKMNFTPSSGAELQTEYFVPRARGYEAIRAVEQLRDQITPHLFVTEIRSIAADDLWMSMAYQRDSLAIHFTFKPETPEVTRLLPHIEAALAPFDPRPHWAKVFTMPPAQLQSRYKKLADFKKLTHQHDPHAKLRNDFLDHNLYNG